MLSPEELAELPERVRKLWLEFEEDALTDIAARIAANGEMVATARWRTNKLKELGEQTKHLQKEISKRLKVSNEYVMQIMKDSIYESLCNDEELLKEAYEKGLIKGYKANPKTINPLLSQGVKLINSTIKQTALSYASKYNNVLSLALDKAHLNVEAGVLSIDEAVKQAVHDLADKGIGAYISSPAGRNERVNKVIERAVRTGVSKSILDAQYENLLELGCDLVEVSSHIGARPSHALWQGEIYSISGKDKRYKPFKETTGYGQIDGLGGINCRHSFYPYFDGISTKSHRTFKLDENEEVYNLRQQYKNALNNAEKYRLRASIEKAGGLDNSKSLKLAKDWKKYSNTCYERMTFYNSEIKISNNYSTPISSRIAIESIKPSEDKIEIDDTVTTQFKKIFKGFKPGDLTSGTVSRSNLSLLDAKSDYYYYKTWITVANESEANHVNTGNNLLSITIHERAHELYNQLAYNRLVSKGKAGLNLVKKEDFFNEINLLNIEIYENCFDDNLEYHEIVNTIIKDLGERAREGTTEFFAEAMVDAFGRRNTSKTGKRVYNWFIKEWNKYV